jgi:hypothetical protein
VPQKNAMNRIIFLLIIGISISSCAIGKKNQSNKFDKEKWSSSSDYRYEIIKNKYFPIHDGKPQSKKHIIKILGEPDFIEGNDFIYCFDIAKNDTTSGLSKCKGSYLIINFDKKILLMLPEFV